jgi:23S rRNA-/tRNA-specific pseudouridylate synthase
MYGRDKMNKYFDKEYGLTRVFLHAAKLSFVHPRTQKKEEFECPLPFDLESVVTEMKAGR